MSDDESFEPAGLTVDAGTIAASNSPAGRDPLRCFHCDTSIGLIVSYGLLTHKATPCGSPVSADVLERNGNN